MLYVRTSLYLIVKLWCPTIAALQTLSTGATDWWAWRNDSISRNLLPFLSSGMTEGTKPIGTRSGSLWLYFVSQFSSALCRALKELCKCTRHIILHRSRLHTSLFTRYDALYTNVMKSLDIVNRIMMITAWRSLCTIWTNKKAGKILKPQQLPTGDKHNAETECSTARRADRSAGMYRQRSRQLMPGKLLCSKQEIRYTWCAKWRNLNLMKWSRRIIVSRKERPLSQSGGPWRSVLYVVSWLVGS